MPFLADLSVSKTHFTDKPTFSSDLSVNFGPLCWGFTDKSHFSEHLSVKPGPKRLNFYGQTAIFDHFVRNHYFWSRSFTDRRPIFIDLSVNGRSFCQMQCSLNQHTKLSVKFNAKLFWVISIIEGNCHVCAKNGSDLQLIANHPVFRFETEFFPVSFRLDIIKNEVRNYEPHQQWMQRY